MQIQSMQNMNKSSANLKTKYKQKTEAASASLGIPILKREFHNTMESSSLWIFSADGSIADAAAAGI